MDPRVEGRMRQKNLNVLQMCKAALLKRRRKNRALT